MNFFFSSYSAIAFWFSLYMEFSIVSLTRLCLNQDGRRRIVVHTDLRVIPHHSAHAPLITLVHFGPQCAPQHLHESFNRQLVCDRTRTLSTTTAVRSRKKRFGRMEQMPATISLILVFRRVVLNLECGLGSNSQARLLRKGNDSHANVIMNT